MAAIYSGSGVIIDLGALPGFRMLSGSTAAPDASTRNDNQPTLCPDKTDEKTGGRSFRAIDYQAQVSGLKPGTEIVLNGVRFDGCRDEDHTMLEAKGERYEYLLGYRQPQETIEADFLRQANAQLKAAAAGSWSVEWHFAEQGAADYARALFEKNRLDIKVVHEPWRTSIH